MGNFLSKGFAKVAKAVVKPVIKKTVAKATFLTPEQKVLAVASIQANSQPIYDKFGKTAAGITIATATVVGGMALAPLVLGGAATTTTGAASVAGAAKVSAAAKIAAVGAKVTTVSKVVSSLAKVVKGNGTLGAEGKNELAGEGFAGEKSAPYIESNTAGKVSTGDGIAIAALAFGALMLKR